MYLLICVYFPQDPNICDHHRLRPSAQHSVSPQDMTMDVTYGILNMCSLKSTFCASAMCLVHNPGVAVPSSDSVSIRMGLDLGKNEAPLKLTSIKYQLILPTGCIS